MQRYSCSKCGTRVFFENRACLACGSSVGFSTDRMAVEAVEPANDTGTLYRRLAAPASGLVRYCDNDKHGVCNWLTAAGDGNGLCAACDLNRVIPNLAEPDSLSKWADFEQAKKRLVYGLMRFGLPLDTGKVSTGRLTFDFARDVVTGHLDGVISVDMAEADAVERARQRQQFSEPYRSLLGHLRHESGHFYWTVLVDEGRRHDEFRRIFGDERADYQAAKSRHYDAGPPADWTERFVSAYASMHPWEDWAETWAHYLHMVETLETAEAEGMEPRAAGFSLGAIWPFKRYDVYREESFSSLMDRWVPLTIAMNSINRSMGHEDFYPFVIPAAAYGKLAFIHQLIRERQ